MFTKSVYSMSQCPDKRILPVHRNRPKLYGASYLSKYFLSRTNRKAKHLPEFTSLPRQLKSATMQFNSTVSLLFIAFTRVNAHENFTPTKDVTDTLLRHKNPLPSSAFKVNTRLGFTNSQDTNPGTLVYPENGGYYLKYPDSEIVVAFSSYNLSAVLDMAHISLYRTLQSRGRFEEAADLAQELAENGVDLHKFKFAEVDLDVHNRCRIHYCAYPGMTGACATYDGCYWCSSRHSCI